MADGDAKDHPEGPGSADHCGPRPQVFTELIVRLSKQERLERAIELRKAGVPLTDIGKQIGYSKAWTCKILKKAGIPLPEVIFDKRGSPRTKHGLRHAPEYYSWYSMKTRCGNPNHADYPNYGGRGITYDPRWECFLEFYKDMGPRPTDGKYTLERIENDKGYCKANCVWLLKSLQTRNQRNTKIDMEKAREIRVLYARGDTTYRELGERYGVASTIIAGVVKGRIWKELAA